MASRSASSRRRTFAGLLAALVACIAHAAGPAVAVAEPATATAQAQAADAGFLAFAPAPPSGAGAVCFVDSGANLTTDTDPAIVHREAIDPAAGLDDGEISLDSGSLFPHGTLMTMIAAAPRNGWGAVGIWPQARVVMVDGLAAGEHDFPVAAYSKGIRRCLNLAATWPIKVIALALGAAGSPSDSELALIENAVQAARQGGLSVVAAAGNDGGAVQMPAAFAPVLAVAAGDAAGSLCDFSSRGAEVDLLAPGCDVDQADPTTGAPMIGAGSSQASAIVGAVIAALRTYRPDLTPDGAEALLVATANRGALDAAAAFDAAGLSDVVAAGRAAEAAAFPAPAPAPPTSPPAPSREVRRPSPDKRSTPPRLARRWPRARASLERTAGTIIVRARNRPRGARLRVEVQEAWELGWITRVRRARATDAVRLNVHVRPHMRLMIVYEGGRHRRQSRALYFPL